MAGNEGDATGSRLQYARERELCSAGESCRYVWRDAKRVDEVQDGAKSGK